MVTLYTARICEFLVKCLCSGLWSGSFSTLPPYHPCFSSFHCFISVTGAWNGGSWLGCRDLPAMGAVFYLGAGWPKWKPLGIPGTHLPLKRGSWLTTKALLGKLFLHLFWRRTAILPGHLSHATVKPFTGQRHAITYRIEIKLTVGEYWNSSPY